MGVIGGRRTLAILAASFLVALTGGAFAEDQRAAEQVIVHGSYLIHKTKTHTPGHLNYGETKYTVSQQVSYAGLNLATQQGMDIFWGRVNETAKNLCGVLDTVAPASFSENQECVNTAMRNAIQTVTDVLAASLDRQQKLASLH